MTPRQFNGLALMIYPKKAREHILSTKSFVPVLASFHQNLLQKPEATFALKKYIDERSRDSTKHN